MCGTIETPSHYLPETAERSTGATTSQLFIADSATQRHLKESDRQTVVAGFTGIDGGVCVCVRYLC